MIIEITEGRENMKNKWFVILLILCVTLFSVSVFSSPVIAQTEQETVATPVAAAEKVETPINSARFLNMLNHNYIYGTDFENVDVMINGSVPALLNSREDDFIPSFIVESFMYDMYGVEIVDMSNLNAEFPQKEGYLYIIPRGFTTYEHFGAEVTLNEDGTFFVTTSVIVTPSDSEQYEAKAVSLFVKNEASAFGYNIVSSEIITPSDCLTV